MQAECPSPLLPVPLTWPLELSRRQSPVSLPAVRLLLTLHRSPSTGIHGCISGLSLKPWSAQLHNTRSLGPGSLLAAREGGATPPLHYLAVTSSWRTDLALHSSIHTGTTESSSRQLHPFSRTLSTVAGIAESSNRQHRPSSRTPSTVAGNVFSSDCPLSHHAHHWGLDREEREEKSGGHL
ncbi:hypothetical protein EYF80_045700 [Liparis tanakae]|uniref:Uncharacterized protein n=1 Tax=Liparis tanakae TaxID=230148 RepID=A0A4Z2FTL6_9TELE|nr:hypothetical protein EYF80_045700 [Liparis tanakae]